MNKLRGTTKHLTTRNQCRIKDYNDYKKRDTLNERVALFLDGSFFEAYAEDAYIVSQYTDYKLHQVSQIAEEDGRAMRLAFFEENHLDEVVSELVGRGYKVAIIRPTNESNTTSTDPPSEERFDIDKHISSLAQYMWRDENISKQQYIEMSRLALQNEEIPKELTDLAEESIYDWCAENNVSYDSVFEGRDLGDVLRLKYRSEEK